MDRLIKSIIITGWLLAFGPAGNGQETATATSIRNATDKNVRYSLKRHHSAPAQPDKILEPGRIDSYQDITPLYISFYRESKRITYRIDPGLPYVFRRDEQDRLELFDGSHSRADALDLAPYVKTPHEVVDIMLRLAGVTGKDMVYDLGCGDGRIIIAAAAQYGARGVGIDIVPERIREAQAAARQAGVSDKAEFRTADVFTADFSSATVVTLYLIPDSNRRLRPLLEQMLRTGTRVVSHGYPIPGWEHKLHETVEYESELEGKHYIYLYLR